MSPAFRLELERDGPYTLGETVRGTVHVVEGGGSRSLEVVLRFVERTADYSHEADSISSGPLHTGDLPTSASFPFAVTLPADGYPGYHSQHGSLGWEVDAASDELGIDSHERRRLQVEAASPA